MAKKATSASFTKGDPRAKAARQLVRANAQHEMRHEMLQVLISKLNEVNKTHNKAYKYLLIDRLVDLGCGLEFTVGKKKFQFPPDKGAIKEILDRLIGRPVQAHSLEGDDGKGSRITIVFDEPGDAGA